LGKGDVSDYFLGLDLGQANDYTAIAVAGLDATYQAAAREQAARYDRLDSARNSPFYERIDLLATDGRLEEENLGPVPEPLYEVRHLERMPLRTPYTEVARRVGVLMETPPLRHNAELVVDATGVGAAVVDILRDAELSFKAVVITGGEKESRNGDTYRVPKRDLISTAQVLLQNRRLRISASLPESRTLVEELVGYRLKQNIATGHVGFEPWREGQHDDLVLALCLALWAAGKPSPSIDESLAGITGDAISEEELYTWNDPLPWEEL
jgi:hypothetical protein